MPVPFDCSQVLFASAFYFIICFTSYFCAIHWLYTFLYYIVSASDFIISFVSCFCARHFTGCTRFLYYIVSTFDFIVGSQMSFECTTHIRPPFFFGVPNALGFLYLLYYTGCTLVSDYIAFCFLSCFCANTVKLEKAVVFLVDLIWRHLQRYLGPRSGLMESPGKKTVPVTAKLLWLHVRPPWRCLWLRLQRCLKPVA